MKDWTKQQSPSRRSSSAWGWILLVAAAATIAFGLHLRSLRSDSTPSPIFPKETLIVSSGTIGVRGALTMSLQKTGLSQPDITLIQRLLRPHFNPRASKPSDLYEVYFSSPRVFVRLRYWPSPVTYYEVQKSTTGVFYARSQDIPLVESTVGVSGQVQVSLWEAMIQQEVPPEMIYRFADLFSWRFDFLTEPRQGDTYKMVWKRKSGNGAILDDAIIAAYYHSKEKGDLYALPVGDDYYDFDGASLRGEFLRAPLAYRRISSRFTNRRYHPILRYYRPHHGIDYSAARGTPVVSIADGLVFKKGYARGLGNELHIRHSNGYVSIYGHLMGFAKGVKAGSRVKQGQLIAYVGSTGLSTGPHLHFGFEKNGKWMDFLSMKASSKAHKIAASQRATFQKVKAEGLVYFSQLTQAGGPLKVLSSPQAPQK